MADPARRSIGSLVLLLALAACSTGSTGEATTSVNVTLQEFAVVPGQSTAASGSVTFIAKNTGPDDEHELVVLKSDLVPTTLPLGGNGGVDEAGAGVTKIGEIEPFPAGQTREATFELAPGKYVLICNIVDTSETPTEVHYKLGMLAGFTVS
jgi:hypothetical protein